MGTYLKGESQKENRETGIPSLQCWWAYQYQPFIVRKQRSGIESSLSLGEDVKKDGINALTARRK